MKKNCLFVLPSLLAILLSACLMQAQTDRASIVIFNDTKSALDYQLRLSNYWSKPAKLQAETFEYVMAYEADKQEIMLPATLSSVKISTAKCSIEMKREDLVKHFHQDPEGRHTWDLHVTDNLLKGFGCSG